MKTTKSTKEKPKRARILIIDDHPAVREALASRIGRHNDLEVCGEAAGVAEALAILSDSRADGVVVDIGLKEGDGIDLVKRMLDRDPGLRILVWSQHSESLYAERALRAGALGYIMKDQATDKIVDAVRRVLERKVWLSDAMTERLLQHNVGGGPGKASPIEALTDREMEVFRLIGEGSKTSEIAFRLHLSVKTVETYRDRIRDKLKLESGAKLAQFAAQWRLIN